MFKLTINLHDDGTVIMDEIISKMYIVQQWKRIFICNKIIENVNILSIF